MRGLLIGPLASSPFFRSCRSYDSRLFSLALSPHEVIQTIKLGLMTMRVILSPKENLGFAYQANVSFKEFPHKNCR